MKKVLVVGASGTIGRAVVDALLDVGDEVVAVSRSTDPSVDLTDLRSIDALFEQVGTVDAVVSATGSAPFVTMAEAGPEHFAEGIAGKLTSQINLVLRGVPHVSDGGSFTVVTGILGQHPIAGSLVSGTVNMGVEGFVTAAATDLPRGLRINAVNPTVIEEALPTYGPFFRGFPPVTAAEAAAAFVRSVHGVETGQVLRVW